MSLFSRRLYRCPWCLRYLVPDPETNPGLLYIHDDVPHPENPTFNGPAGAVHVYPTPSLRHEN